MMALKQCGVGVLLVLVLGVCNAQSGNPVGAPAQPKQPTLLNVPGLGGISNSPQTPLSVQLKQMLGPVKKLTWHYPQAPVQPQQPAVHFEPPQPVRATSVAVQCSENNVYVQVKKDFLGTGELISPAEITLGGCAATGEDSAAQVYLFQSELQLCNGVSMMTEDELVYSFNIIYVPKTSTPSSVGSPVVRTKSTVVGIQCHYPRKFNVSSNALLPAWIPYAATVTAEERLVFSLRLMMDDWQFERPSNQYILGDFINIEAAVMQYNHVPLRIFVDSCVATTVPDLNTTPRYSFIENHGCLVDAKLTGSQSRFLPRVQSDKLQFQLEAFVFEQQRSGLIYLTCFLKAAAAASAPTDAVHKACSFSNNGWTSVDGDSRVCSCCDTNCGSRAVGQVLPGAAPQWQGSVSLGPIRVNEKVPFW
ncbi:zona pellucida sperm-binding protein 3-like isoform X1 [Astyanax mexicanus]|uniref:zona pellucida sperm-binding protein 3-like isoform X1 n=1 Tax=Astyanax mexicanus TaxID=7994 RepID=UPI0020CABAF4|nr:zona pellucida sperm-binding protein 3-like isoform X1 [Astyanax mexicanus]